MATALVARTSKTCNLFSDDQSTFRTFNAGAGPIGPEPQTLHDEQIVAVVEELGRSVVDAALSTAKCCDDDPLLRDLTPLGSLARSLVTRAGQVIPDIIATVLRANGQTVLREFALPQTQTARDLVANNRMTGPIMLPHNDGIVGYLHADLIVIDPDTHHATILECVRGSTALSKPKTKALIRSVRTATLSARSALGAEGYRVDDVTCGVYERYGRAGHDDDMTIREEAIDDFFGVPIAPYLMHFDGCVYSHLSEAVPDALGAVIAMHSGIVDPSAEMTGRPSTEAPRLSRVSLAGNIMSIDVAKLVSPADRRRSREAESDERQPAGPARR
ncbi:hypothetical protein [Notoacmeibacter ruber]|uniref:Uncharacterized protein n=1 Tax=Notoacmeibacter ruber TaxID=2670375 RepID=A0A3L7JAC8_9HYPH|nr:hypothetical protein [Notoacmeibacter ruber]RLQ87374.1 hypothetical protein D8780_03270 [Notoacmeibacter ruber]